MSEDSRDPRVRLGQVFDPGSWDVLAGAGGVLTGRGLIAGVPAVGFCTDGGAGCRHIVEAVDTAVLQGSPVVGLWASGGIDELGAGPVFAAMTRAAGKVPQVAVVLGSAGGEAGYGPALSDVVVMTGNGRKSEVHVTTKDEAGAYRHARHIVELLGAQGGFDLDTVRCGQDLLALLPQSHRQVYDVKALVRALLDAGADGLGIFEELQAKWAPNVLTGLGRLGRRTIGVVANNPIYRGGRLDSLAATKAANFVRRCDAFGVPLLVVAEVAADSAGPESDGEAWHGSELVHAFANAAVPRVTLMPRKAYGEGYVAMNSRSLGATAVFTWAGAEVAVMPARPAVRTLHQHKLAAVPHAVTS